MKTVGSRAEVWHGTAKKTSGGLLKKDLKKNKRGRIVSKKMSNRAKKEKRLEKAGYKTKKGVFKKFKAKKKGGMNGNNNETNKAKPSPLKTMTNLPYESMLTFLPIENLDSLKMTNKDAKSRVSPSYINKRIYNNLISEHGSIDKALIEAVKNGNKRGVIILLSAKADTNVKDIKTTPVGGKERPH